MSSQLLFSGKDISDWQQVGSGKFILKEGLLQTEGGMGILYYAREKFGNCIIRVVYKTTHATSNSGVFIRIADKPTDEWYPVNNGYEIQILDQAEDAYHLTGSIYTMTKSTFAKPKPPGEWNVMEIRLEGENIAVSVNGDLVSELTPNTKIHPPTRDNDPKRGPRPVFGYIGLQNHDHDAKEPNNHVYFKEVSVRPL